MESCGCGFPSVDAPSQARRWLAPLASRIEQDSLSDVRTVVSELVAVSVANGARKLIEVGIDLDDGDSRGVLCDDGSGARAVSRGDSNSLVARIVDGLVEEWDASDARSESGSG